VPLRSRARTNAGDNEDGRNWIMDTIAALLEQIPATVWAAIIGSALTVAGVVISNWNNARERDRERVMTLKRDVYMPAVDAVMGLHRLLIEIADLERPVADIERRTTELISKLSAINVVGSANTVAVITAFELRCMTASIQLRAQRRFTKPIADSSAALFAKIKAEPRTSIALSEEVARDERYKRLEAVIEGDTRQFNADLSATFKLVKMSLEKAREVDELVPPIILAFRKELGLALDQEAYLKVWRESSAAGYAYAERVLGVVEGLLKDLVPKREGGAASSPRNRGEE
jgi:hypothetical protein